MCKFYLVRDIIIRRVWKCQRGNQNPYIEEEQTTQWSKEKVQKDKQLSTKHTYKTKGRVTRTPLNTGNELKCSGRVGSSCSTSDGYNLCMYSVFHTIKPTLNYSSPKNISLLIKRNQIIYRKNMIYEITLMQQFSQPLHKSHIFNSPVSNAYMTLHLTEYMQWRVSIFAICRCTMCLPERYFSRINIYKVIYIYASSRYGTHLIVLNNSYFTYYEFWRRLSRGKKVLP